MTLRNFPPADQCTTEDLDAIADLVVSDPRASYDLAGSREHLEALCRRYQALAQERDAACATIAALERDIASTERYLQAEQRATKERDAAIAALQRDLARVTNERDDARKAAAAAIGDGALRRWEESLRTQQLQAHLIDSLRNGMADRENEIARVNNERQAEVLAAETERECADTAESVAEIFEATARAALAILSGGTNAKPVDLAELVRAVDGRLARALVRERTIGAAVSRELEQALRLLEEHRQTLHHNDRIQSALASTCEAVTGKPIALVNLELDAELAAHPDAGPLHHARDQRDHQEDNTP